MSTANTVPLTHDLEGDDAAETLRNCGVRHLLRDSFKRFRLADGFSHSRALAFQFVLTLLPALIAVVGLANELGQEKFSAILSQTFRDLAPGPAGEVLTSAIEQSSDGGGGTALFVGLAAAIIAGTTAMGQIERGANRIYGIERDRPAVAKYTRAAILAATAGTATILALVVLVAGRELGDAVKEVIGLSDTVDTIWNIARWPLSAALAIAPITSAALNGQRAMFQIVSMVSLSPVTSLTASPSSLPATRTISARIVAVPAVAARTAARVYFATVGRSRSSP